MDFSPQFLENIVQNKLLASVQKLVWVHNVTQLLEVSLQAGNDLDRCTFMPFNDSQKMKILFSAHFHEKWMGIKFLKSS